MTPLKTQRNPPAYKPPPHRQASKNPKQTQKKKKQNDSQTPPAHSPPAPPHPRRPLPPPLARPAQHHRLQLHGEPDRLPLPDLRLLPGRPRPELHRPRLHRRPLRRQPPHDRRTQQHLRLRRRLVRPPRRRPAPVRPPDLRLQPHQRHQQHLQRQHQLHHPLRRHLLPPLHRGLREPHLVPVGRGHEPVPGPHEPEHRGRRGVPHLLQVPEHDPGGGRGQLLGLVRAPAQRQPLERRVEIRGLGTEHRGHQRQQHQNHRDPLRARLQAPESDPTQRLRRRPRRPSGREGGEDGAHRGAGHRGRTPRGVLDSGDRRLGSQGEIEGEEGTGRVGGRRRGEEAGVRRQRVAGDGGEPAGRRDGLPGQVPGVRDRRAEGGDGRVQPQVPDPGVGVQGLRRRRDVRDQEDEVERLRGAQDSAEGEPWQPSEAGGLLHRPGGRELLPRLRVHPERVAPLVAPRGWPPGEAGLEDPASHRGRRGQRPPVHPRAYPPAGRPQGHQEQQHPARLQHAGQDRQLRPRQVGLQRHHHAHRGHPGLHRPRVSVRRGRVHEDGRVLLRGRLARAGLREGGDRRGGEGDVGHRRRGLRGEEHRGDREVREAEGMDGRGPAGGRGVLDGERRERDEHRDLVLEPGSVEEAEHGGNCVRLVQERRHL